MAKIILDTCTWLDLAKPKFSEVLSELECQVEEGITILITCEIIVEEWERNKQKIIKEISNSIKSYAKSAINIANYLPEEEKEKLNNILEKYRDIESEQLKIAKSHFKRVENLFNKSQIFKIENELKLKIIERGINKLAPFHNSKNNISDALIYFGAIDFVQSSWIIANEIIFVSQNTKEFSDPNNINEIHPDLKTERVYYSTNLASALKMRKEIIDEFDENNEAKFEAWIDIQIDESRGK